VKLQSRYIDDIGGTYERNKKEKETERRRKRR